MTGMSWAPFPSANVYVQRMDWGCLYSYAKGIALRDFDRAVMVLGAFDGVHQGHRALVSRACADAREHGVPCVVVTFDPDPSEVVGKQRDYRRLLCVADRSAALLSLGVDYVACFDFTPDFSLLSPDAFVDELYARIACPTSIHAGTNFRFGCHGAGDVATLVHIGEHRHFDVFEHDLVVRNDQRVSSTRIRRLLREAKLDEANELLGRCHYVRGEVAHGRGEGTSFGFPTANVVCDVCDCMPAEGVYAGYVIEEGLAWPSAINVGPPRSFTTESMPAFMEANLIGFSGDLYGKSVAVSFVRWLRAPRTFDSLEELESVVLGNIDWVREHLGSSPVEVAP